METISPSFNDGEGSPKPEGHQHSFKRLPVTDLLSQVVSKSPKTIPLKDLLSQVDTKSSQKIASEMFLQPGGQQISTQTLPLKDLLSQVDTKSPKKLPVRGLFSHVDTKSPSFIDGWRSPTSWTQNLPQSLTGAGWFTCLDTSWRDALLISLWTVTPGELAKHRCEGHWPVA